MFKLSILLLFLCVTMNKLSAQQIFPLYSGKIPNSKQAANKEKTEERDGIIIVSEISEPEVRYFPVTNQASLVPAVIIFPGGGYKTNSLSHEGDDVARKFNEIGVTAFVVKYRLPDDRIMHDKEIGPLQDAQQTIKIVREQADKYKIDPERIGVLGFSAGGHLASTVGTHFKKTHIANDSKISLRPDFMILIYPVISFQDGIAHVGSRDNLLGTNPQKAKADLYSNELQITAETPPAFLIHATDDEVVVPANSIRFYENLLKHNISAEMHIYQKGGHGFGLNNSTTREDWFLACKHWMQSNGWLATKNN
jgi:acetyl esterase/lipase